MDRQIGAGFPLTSVWRSTGRCLPTGAKESSGEASPLYVVSHRAAERIRDVCSRPKVIALFREPSSFLRSLHLQNVQAMSEDVHDLRLALQLEPARRSGRGLPSTNYRPALLFYSEFVQYADQLTRLQRALGEENVLPIVYEDFREITMRSYVWWSTFSRLIRWLSN